MAVEGEILTFTRIDLENLREMMTTVKTLDEKLDTLGKGIAACQANCKEHRDKVDGRVKTLETQQNRWIGRDGVILIIVPLIISLIGWWVFH